MTFEKCDMLIVEIRKMLHVAKICIEHACFTLA